MKSKSFFALLLAVCTFFGAMVFSQSETLISENSEEPLSEDISAFIPDVQFLQLFKDKEEELDALSASRAKFTAISKKMEEYQDIAGRRRESQEKALEELRELQKSIKNNQEVTTKEKDNIEADIIKLEKEIEELMNKQEETKILLRKFYQQGYLQEIQNSQDMTFMSLLLPKSFGSVVTDSEVNDIMKVTSQGLIARQKMNKENMSQIQLSLEGQKNQRVRAIVRMERYDAELTTTESMESKLLGKTIARQGALSTTLESSQNNTKVLTDKFEQKFAEYEKGILNYSEQYNCSVNRSAICTWVKNYLTAEKSLRMHEEKISSFAWPVPTTTGFGFHFRDQKYHNIHNEHHTGIDIISREGEPVTAIYDGYIIATRNATAKSAGIIIMKHRDGLLTFYKNIRVKKDLPLFTIMKKGDMIGTVGPRVEHSDTVNLHLEMYVGGVLTDPVEKISFDTIDPKYIPARYGWKYIDDMRRAKKEIVVESVQKIINFFYIPGSNEIERQKNMINKYAGSMFRDQKMWIEESAKEGIDPSFVLCVGFAESTLGQNLTTSGNIGNVGNTDSGDRRDYDSARSGIRAIASVVNNRWLGHYNTIDQLSGWGNPRGPIYASSPTNWHENIVKCMSALKGKYIGNTSSFRLNTTDSLSYQKEGYQIK